jgi:hypothetical protein
LIFKVTDKDGEYKEKSIKITVEQSGTAVYKFENKILGSFNDEQFGSFYSVEDDIAYLGSAAQAHQAKIDWCYFKGSSLGETLAATDDAAAGTVFAVIDENWTTRNATRFAAASITAAEFDAIADGSIIEFEEWTSGESNKNQLAVDDVIFFKLVDGRLGYIKVNETYTKGDKMKMDVIVMVP